MALTLIKEDGTARTDANSYATAADGDAYHDGHLYASTWTSATTARKEAALVMATRLVDSQCQFNGYRVSDQQALQWPRWKCPDPDGGLALIPLRLLPRGMGFVDYNTVPKAVRDATCEMARELLVQDRTAAPPGQGIDTVHTGHTDAAGTGTGASDNSTTKYSKADTRPVISQVAQAMLVKYGSLTDGGGGPVRLFRV